MNLENTQDMFPIGTPVNVEAMPDDMFLHEFAGHVTGHNKEFVQVTDQDGDVWDCVPGQLSIG